MQVWQPVLLGLLASALAGENRSVLQTASADSSRRLAEFTDVCPNIRKFSLKACDRCLSNEMCPYDAASKTQWICNGQNKRCGHPDWDANQTIANCPEDVKNYSDWGAMCRYTCLEQAAPFNCAGFCLNEDYPCKWVPNCHATNDGALKGMTPDSKSCLRPCGDHDSMMKVSLKYKNMADHFETCTEAAAFYGCSDKWGAGINEHCPHTCRSGGAAECKWRCGRDELHTEDKKQCWQVVERTINPYSCAKAISEGMDCHCKCAGAYLQLARAGGGSFKADGFFGDEGVAYNKTFTANKSFAISLSGQAMWTKTVTDAWGPRLKLVVKGQDCKYGRLISGFTGIQCVAPPPGSASATVASTCVTPPSTFSPYLHRWTGLTIDHCAEYDVCHCNHQCDLTKNWHKAGSLKIEPPKEVGAVSKAMPGCLRPIPSYPAASQKPKTEKPVETKTSFDLKFFGGIAESQKSTALAAAKKALAPFLKDYSWLMKRDVPTTEDIEVSFAKRLLEEEDDSWFTSEDLEGTPPAIRFDFLAAKKDRGRQLLDGCSDNATAFRAEARKVNIFDNSCADLLASLGGSAGAMCGEASLQAALKAGCRKTCSLCPQLSTTTTSPAPTAAPDVQAEPTLSFAFTVTTHTDFSAANVLGRLGLLRTDPGPFLQRLYVEMENAKVPENELPARLWVSLAKGPKQVVIPKVEEEEKLPEKAAFTGTSIVFMVLGSAIGGSCAFGLLLVSCWYCWNRRAKWRKVAPETTAVHTVTQVSEGGYRVKKIEVGGEVIEPEKAEPDCLEKLCGRCYKRCCKKKLKKAKAWSQEISVAPADPSELRVGCKVRLFGLNQAHFNGLTGIVVDGPNEKGRYEIDLLVVNTDNTEEHQTLSFKPANMKVLPSDEPQDTRTPLKPHKTLDAADARVPGVDLQAGVQRGPSEGGSYRTGR